MMEKAGGTGNKLNTQSLPRSHEPAGSHLSLGAAILRSGRGQDEPLLEAAQSAGNSARSPVVFDRAGWCLLALCVPMLGAVLLHGPGITG